MRARLRSLPRPLAFVFPGGGALGAYQAGVVHALTEIGVEPDLLVGVSAGSVNAAMLAFDHSPTGVARLEQTWRELRRRDLLRLHPGRVALAMSGLRPSLLDNRPGRQWLRRHFGARRIEDAPTRLAIVATDLDRGVATAFTEGPVVSAVLASSAFPGAYPPVERDGRTYIDGGVVADVPLDLSVELGARSAIVVQVPDLPDGVVSRRAIDILLRASSLGVEAHGRTVLRRPPPELDVVAVPAGTSEVTTFAINQSARLVDEGYERAQRWFEEDAHPERRPAQ